MSSNLEDVNIDLFKQFFEQEVARRATAPLRNGVELALYLDGKGPVTLKKEKEGMVILQRPPEDPDMSFWAGTKGLQQLIDHQTNDVGEIGVEIMKLMIHSDSDYRLKAKVHIHPFTLLRNGYLGVLPLGGPTVMKFLASKGLTNISKIKDAISSLKG